MPLRFLLKNFLSNLILTFTTHLNNKIIRKFLYNFGFIEKEIIKLSMKNILEDKERIAYELKVK